MTSLAATLPKISGKAALTFVMVLMESLKYWSAATSKSLSGSTSLIFSVSYGLAGSRMPVALSRAFSL